MNKKEYLLIKLMEEAAEIQQATSKALLFGLDNHHPERPFDTNESEIFKELLDLYTTYLMLKSEGVFDEYNLQPDLEVDKYIKIKELKIENYMKISNECCIYDEFNYTYIKPINMKDVKGKVLVHFKNSETSGWYPYSYKEISCIDSEYVHFSDGSTLEIYQYNKTWRVSLYDISK